MGQNKQTIEKKKAQAKQLYLKTDLMGKEIAKRVDVAHKTLSGWNKQYGWAKTRKRKETNRLAGITVTSFLISQQKVLNDLQTFTIINNPDSFPTVEKAINEFIEYTNSK